MTFTDCTVYCVATEHEENKVMKSHEQAGAELGQVQLKLFIRFVHNFCIQHTWLEELLGCQKFIIIGLKWIEPQISISKS